MRKLLMLLSIAWFVWIFYRLLKNRQPREQSPPPRKKVDSSVIEKDDSDNDKL